jgi:hypothetical protein
MKEREANVLLPSVARLQRGFDRSTTPGDRGNPSRDAVDDVRRAAGRTPLASGVAWGVKALCAEAAWEWGDARPLAMWAITFASPRDCA